MNGHYEDKDSLVIIQVLRIIALDKKCPHCGKYFLRAEVNNLERTFQEYINLEYIENAKLAGAYSNNTVDLTKIVINIKNTFSKFELTDTERPFIEEKLTNYSQRLHTSLEYLIRIKSLF